jgi:four helix bundle protein
MSTVKRFEDLEVWKLARLLCKDVFQITVREAFSKDFGLKDQIRNSSGSIMDNIAEGFELKSYRKNPLIWDVKYQIS